MPEDDFPLLEPVRGTILTPKPLEFSKCGFNGENAGEPDHKYEYNRRTSCERRCTLPEISGGKSFYYFCPVHNCSVSQHFVYGSCAHELFRCLPSNTDRDPCNCVVDQQYF